MNRGIFGFVFILSLASCGGGTEGTSSTSGFGAKVIRGSVSDNNTAVVGAKVSVEGGSEFSETDSEGLFTLATEDTSNKNNLSLKVDRVGQSKTFSIPDLIEQTSGLNVALKLESDLEQSNFNGIEFTVLDIIGKACQGKFGQLRTFNFTGNPVPLLIINQLQPVEFGEECKILVRLSFKGEVQANTRLELFSDELISTTNKSTLEERLSAQKLVSTSEVIDSGVVEVNFKYEKNIGFFLLEVSSGLPRNQRVGIVISLLYQGQL